MTDNIEHSREIADYPDVPNVPHVSLIPTNLIISGSEPRRGEPDFTNDQIHEIWGQLDVIEANCARAGRPINSVTTGAAPRGVDRYATEWARDRNIRYHEFPANWAEYSNHPGSNPAGPIRNKQMVRTTIDRYGRSGLLVYGFTTKPLEQSRGTRSCLEIAGRQFGLPTHLYRLDTHEWEF